MVENMEPATPEGEKDDAPRMGAIDRYLFREPLNPKPEKSLRFNPSLGLDRRRTGRVKAPYVEWKCHPCESIVLPCQHKDC